VVCATLVAVLTGGVVNVCVAVAVAVALTVVTAVVLALLAADVVVCVALARPFSGGTGTAAPGRVTVAWAAVPESVEASDPVWAGAGDEVDLTALPIPKPAAIAITSNAPSSHLRRSMFPPSLRPVPIPIVVAMSTGEPVPCHPAR
jgi:hypothetical protein